MLAALLVLGLVGRGGPGQAAAPARSPVTQRLNARMAQKYPGLAPLLRDPDAFLETMRGRFDAQKQRTPDRPYDFDFSELGMPTVRELHAGLLAQLARLREAPATKDNAIRVEHLGRLVREAEGHLERGAIGYRQLVELSYFGVRALGQAPAAQASSWQRALLRIDRKIQGYTPLAPADELALYERRGFAVFPQQSSSPTMRDAAPAFERAFANPERLESLWIPSHVAIERDVLMRLMPKSIEIVGVASQPIMADGFLRPSADFWMHDVRHSSNKLQKRQRYVARHRLTAAQLAALDEKADQWNTELEAETEAVADPALRDAIKLMSFNFHHDRGFVVAPSEYLSQKHRLWVPGLLYFTEKIGGEGAPFRAPLRNFRRADAWLSAFWQRRAADEQAIWRDAPTND